MVGYLVNGNKKGTVTDVAFLIGSILFIAFFCFVGYFVFNMMSGKMQANPQINSSAEAVQALQSIDKTSDKFDYFIIVVFIGLVLAIIITSWFLGGEPIFLILYFLVMIILVVISMIISNVWERVTQASVFMLSDHITMVISRFPMTNNLLTYLPIYIGVVGFLGMVAMFAKPYMGGGGGDGY